MIRNSIIETLQSVIFRMQTSRYFFGRRRLKYQPLPWVGIMEAGRGNGTADRMNTIEKYLIDQSIDGGSVLDIGCNTGYFSLSLKEKGYFAYGVDSNIRNLEIAQYVSLKMKGVEGGFFPMHMSCDRKKSCHLPHCDITLCLSVWHHWLKQYSYDEATDILREIYSKTRSVLFFETGELEMTADYPLPFRGQDPRRWLQKYLSDVCQDSTVEWLGVHRAFAPKTTENDGVVLRNLFAVQRNGCVYNV